MIMGSPSEATEILMKGPVEDAKREETPRLDVPAEKIDSFALVAGGSQLLSLVLFAACSDYERADETGTDDMLYYNSVAFMVLLGFAYLMTFLRRYALGSVGLTLFLTSMAIQWAVITQGLWQGVYKGGEFKTIKIGIFSLVEATFGAASLLITFGCLIGKMTPTPLAVVAVLQQLAYTLNVEVTLAWLKPSDVGGTIAIHLFGASFGLGAAWVWGAPSHVGETHERSSRASDVFSLLGTLILWVLWPSFNAAAVPAEDADARLRAIINTVLAMCGSCVATFIASRLFSRGCRFGQPEIQNSTLAGGVAIGASANMIVKPAGALAIGIAAGLLSTWGFRKFQPAVAESLGLHDTCGVMNLHFMPAILGAAASTIVAAIANPTNGYDDNFNLVFAHGSSQWGYQLAAAVLTAVCGSLSGALVALVLLCTAGKKEDLCKTDGAFCDQAHWEMDEEMRKQHV
mmetsp:Transcript_13830/g.26366  ORF Transcript_13830/g.26366 Transcript_13830/m.26366 type:complete len:459 (-) Transcript_13830:376-1752(-)